MLLQQGDVIIESVHDIPKDAKKVMPKDIGYILAEGEATGHKHRIKDVKGIEITEKDGMFFIKIDTPKKVIHEEHKTIELPIGKWKVRKVREYDHFLEESREVTD